MRLAHIFSFLKELVSVSEKEEVSQSIYDFKLRNLSGNKEIDFAQFRGKKLLLVNTASKCGLTPQYKDLEELSRRFRDKVIVLGFPANNFLGQEPGSNTEIAEFCEINYGVSFQMSEKISVRGKDQHPLFRWLQAKTGRKPDWNFAKYVVNEDGENVRFFRAGIGPLDNRIIEEISR